MKIEHVSIIAFIGLIIYLYWNKPGTIVTQQSQSAVQASAPWFLLYNYPVGFNSAGIALPTRSLGLAGAQMNPNDCAVCSLFPVTPTMQ